MLLAARGWIIGDEQARPPYAEFNIGPFCLQLGMQGHLEIRKDSHPQEGIRGLVYDQASPTDEGYLIRPDHGEQCLKLMRAMMVLEELADV